MNVASSATMSQDAFKATVNAPTRLRNVLRAYADADSPAQYVYEMADRRWALQTLCADGMVNTIVFGPGGKSIAETFGSPGTFFVRGHVVAVDQLKVVLGEG